MKETECVHHWDIEPVNGPTSTGKCRICGEEKEFNNTLNEPPPFTIKEEDPMVKKKRYEYDQDKERIISAYHECGDKVKVLSRKLGVAEGTLYSLLYRWGVKERPKRVPATPKLVDGKATRRKVEQARPKLEQVIDTMKERHQIRAIPTFQFDHLPHRIQLTVGYRSLTIEDTDTKVTAKLLVEFLIASNSELAVSLRDALGRDMRLDK